MSVETANLPSRPPVDWAILRGWILYDGHCGLCQHTANRWKGRLLPLGFVFVSSIDEEARHRRLGCEMRPVDELRLVRTDGRTFGGSRAVGEIARYIGWAKPLAWSTRFAWTAPLVEWIYRRVAKNRHRIGRLLGYRPCDDTCSPPRG